MSAVLTIVGDMNCFWLLLFLSFFGPSMVKKRGAQASQSEDKQEQREHTVSDLKLTKRGASVVAKFMYLFEKVDSKIPKFSSWLEQ